MSATRTLQTLAIAKIEKAEGFTPEEVLDAVERIVKDPDLANAYLALSNPHLGTAFMRREITRFPGSGRLPTLQVLAIAKIEKAGGFTQEETVNAAECLVRDSELANMYLSLDNPDIGAAFIRREITKFRSRTQWIAARQPIAVIRALYHKDAEEVLDECVHYSYDHAFDWAVAFCFHSLPFRKRSRTAPLHRKTRPFFFFRITKRAPNRA